MVRDDDDDEKPDDNDEKTEWWRWQFLHSIMMTIKLNDDDDFLHIMRGYLAMKKMFVAAAPDKKINYMEFACNWRMTILLFSSVLLSSFLWDVGLEVA